MERLQHTGIIIKRPYVPERTGPENQQIFSSNPIHQHLLLLDSVTVAPERHVYEKQVHDSQKGMQTLRMIKTAKPYNPDFVSSAQSLTFVFPEHIGDVIATPLDGDQQTWTELFRMNRQSVDTMTELYSNRDIGNFVITTGMNFSPYSITNNYLRTQSVQAAHIHAFLISDRLLDNTVQFADAHELREVQEGMSSSDLDRDRRRFFPGPIQNLFSDILTNFVTERLKASSPALDIKRKSDEERYPLDGVYIDGRSSAFLESEEMYLFIRDTYAAVDEFYSNFFMPIFTSNYHEIIASDLPIADALEYNSLEVANAVLEEKMHQLPAGIVNQANRRRLQELVRRIQPMLNGDNHERFALGPAVSYSSVFDPERDSVRTYMVAGLFGGGSVESLGINKIPLAEEEQKQLLVNFSSQESANLENEFDAEVRRKLAHSHSKKLC